MKVYEIGKLIGQMWRDLPADQKQEYADQFEVEKVTYSQPFEIISH
jgi:SWI/SNF-related matrix-associated actin-dependent regulator of chromatin subfamily E protein 1